MAWACMTFKVSIICWANTILGVFGVIDFVLGLINDFNKYSSSMVMNYVIGVVIFSLIFLVWLETSEG